MSFRNTPTGRATIMTPSETDDELDHWPSALTAAELRAILDSRLKPLEDRINEICAGPSDTPAPPPKPATASQSQSDAYSTILKHRRQELIAWKEDAEAARERWNAIYDTEMAEIDAGTWTGAVLALQAPVWSVDVRGAVAAIQTSSPEDQKIDQLIDIHGEDAVCRSPEVERCKDHGDFTVRPDWPVLRATILKEGRKDSGRQRRSLLGRVMRDLVCMILLALLCSWMIACFRKKERKYQPRYTWL